MGRKKWGLMEVPVAREQTQLIKTRAAAYEIRPFESHQH